MIKETIALLALLITLAAMPGASECISECNGKACITVCGPVILNNVPLGIVGFGDVSANGDIRVCDPDPYGAINRMQKEFDNLTANFTKVNLDRIKNNSFFDN